MLKLHFINVADGDSILVEALSGPRPFRLLVDTGLSRVEPVPGSLRGSCAGYLKRLGIRHIDVLVVTHLHLDHFGGIGELLRQASVDRVYTGYVPPRQDRRLPLRPTAQKTIQGQIQCLNLWCETVARLEQTGCQIHTVTHDQVLTPTDRLRVELLAPNKAVQAIQTQVWDRLLDGQAVPEDLEYWASKARNPGSMRLRLQYAGRRIELAGDCYGAMWDWGDLKPCDILKVPHHGDCKAVTEELVRKLRPRHAVISCAAEYIPRKDRPSARTAELLTAQGAQLWFTDAFSAPWHAAPRQWPAAVFSIQEDGTILTPNAPTESGRLT